jgi:hypothetical protein
MTMANKAYPVHLRGELTIPPGRWVWLFKWLLGIPHYVVLFFLGVAAIFCSIISFFAILFTGKYPRGLFDFNVGVMRWGWRVGFYSYMALGTDKYPPFSLDKDPSYPADLEVEYPEKLSQGLVLIKWWLLAIPHYLVVGIFQGGNAGRGWGGLTSLLAVFGAIYCLFTGKHHEDMFKIVMATNRWTYRVLAYTSLMRDEYPPFRLDE